jgi:hypothetical protein
MVNLLGAFLLPACADGGSNAACRATAYAVIWMRLICVEIGHLRARFPLLLPGGEQGRAQPYPDPISE